MGNRNAKKKTTEEIFEVIMTENFPRHLMSDIKSQIQELREHKVG